MEKSESVNIDNWFSTPVQVPGLVIPTIEAHRHRPSSRKMDCEVICINEMFDDSKPRLAYRTRINTSHTNEPMSSLETCLCPVRSPLRDPDRSAFLARAFVRFDRVFDNLFFIVLIPVRHS